MKMKIFSGAIFFYVFLAYVFPPLSYAVVGCSQTQNGGCSQVQTAIGPISTNPGALVGNVLQLIVGISGGAAVLLIIAAGYQMMTSQGNPEKVKEARERLTSAVVGLLFIFFSVTILQIIGIDLLHIPGFISR